VYQVFSKETNMICLVCGQPNINMESMCEYCGSEINEPLKPPYVKVPQLSEDLATLHFNALRNPVKAGFVQISTQLRKASLLDIQGQLTNAIDTITKSSISYILGDSTFKGTCDFIYVGDYLQRLINPKKFLKDLRNNLKPMGVVEFYLPKQKDMPGHRFVFAVPAFYSMLMLCGYTVIERTIFENEDGLLVCSH